MSAYTIDELCFRGAPYAMTMLLRLLRGGEQFVTYGAIKVELEYQLKIKTIFTTQIGWVAGALIRDILKRDPKAPLLNVLITRQDGIPSKGVAGFLADRYEDDKLRRWDSVTRARKLAIVERERKKIFEYTNWEKLASELYGVISRRTVRSIDDTENDYNAVGGYGGEAESEEHRKLKLWVSRNPDKIGVAPIPQHAEIEARLRSGDEIDVMFSSGTTFHVVEVKSSRSNYYDHRRGIYQCVKYREVKRAEWAPYTIDIDAILVTEAPLTPELVERAKLLGVKWRQVKVN